MQNQTNKQKIGGGKEGGKTKKSQISLRAEAKSTELQISESRKGGLQFFFFLKKWLEKIETKQKEKTT